MKTNVAIKSLAVIALSVAAVTALAAPLYPVVVNDRWGYVDKAGTLVINPQFERAEPFAAGLAGVRLGRRWGFVDAAGKLSINPQFDGAGSFSDGLAAV